MNTLLFVLIVLVSGFSAGMIHGLVNLVVTEPFLDKAIQIENQNLLASGKAQDTPQFWKEFDQYRTWQKQGEVIAAGVLGLSIGALFGLVFAYSRHILPGENHVKKALVLAGIMWFTLFFIPFLKYPANPPTVGDPSTIFVRSTLYVSFVALSGLGALGFSRIYKKFQNNYKRVVVPLAYAVYVFIVFVLMPQNPDKILAPAELLNGFRIASASTVTMFWIVDAVILGMLWQKFQPHLERHNDSAR